MTYQPVTPLGGIAGWAFLNRTKARQSSSFANSPEIKRDIAYFRNNIGKITSAKDLVANRRLLKVALGAYGLDGDLNKRFFIRKVLEGGTANPKAMANRLVDKRYVQLTNAFGFGSTFGRRNSQAGFGNKLTSAYITREFEIAVGKNNDTFRLAMSFQREIAEIANNSGTGNTGWYRIIGSPPTKKVFEEAFRLPSAFSSLNIDRQVSTLKDKVQSAYGAKTTAVFKDPKNVQNILRQFLVARSISGQSSALSGQSAALSILKQGMVPDSGASAMDAIFNALYRS